MSEKPGNVELGTLRETHPVNNERRGRGAAILLIAGVPVTVLAVVWWVIAEERSRKVRFAVDPVVVPSVAVGLGLGLLFTGIGFGIMYLTHRGEAFELHDNGLRYRRAGHTQTIAWADVDRVAVKPGKNNAITRWAGGDISCVVHITGGKKVHITGLTQNARELIQHIETATPR